MLAAAAAADAAAASYFHGIAPRAMPACFELNATCHNKLTDYQHTQAGPARPGSSHTNAGQRALQLDSPYT